MFDFKYISKKRVSGKFIIGFTGEIKFNVDTITEFIHYKNIPTSWCHHDYLFNEKRFIYDYEINLSVPKVFKLCEAISQSELLKEIYGFTDN